MRKGEWLLVGVVYACLLMAALGLIHAFGWQSEGPVMVVSTIVAIQLASWLYHRHTAESAPLGLRMLLGAMLAALCVVVCMIAQWRWGVLEFPAVVITIHALGTAIMLVLLFNTFRKSLGRTPPTDSPLPPATVTSIAAAAIVIAMGAVAFAELTPTLGRRVAEQKFPGLAIALPQWRVSSVNTLRYERGDYKLDAPQDFGRSITLRWETGDVPEEILDGVWRDGGMSIGPKEPVTVAGHAGATQFISSDKKRVYLTTWRCPEDHRWLCLMTFLDLPRETLLAMHESMLSSVRCHTEGKRAAPQPMYAKFVPPAGWDAARAEIAEVGFVGPNDELVIVGIGTVGRHEMLGPDVPEQAIHALVKSTLALESIDRTDKQVVTDGRGHRRTIWSCSGKDSDGQTFQAELMAWHCPVRDATFMIWYMTPSVHDPSAGTNMLLRADCHENTSVTSYD